jgi:OmpA-OmpF porin, OOP family
MNKLAKLVFAASAVVAISASAQAQTDAKALTPASGYVQDARGIVVRSGTGLCYRTGYFTPADQKVAGCDGFAAGAAKPDPAKPDAAKPPAKPAPVFVAAEKVSLAADALFDFDKAVLKSEGKAKLDDIASKLKGIDLEVIIAVGHTDSVGSDDYNQKLSIRRAEAVKAYLVSKGIADDRVYTEGKGESQPVADNKSADGRAKNRRVEVEVVGNKRK